MAYVIEQRTGLRHRFVFELRYEGGELYWDRCGRIARSLAAREGWALQSMDINGCHIQKEEQNLVFSYSATRLDLTQTQSREVSQLLAPGQFAAIAEEYSEAVVRSLDLNFFPRIGFRLWTLYGTQSIEDASCRIARMSFLSPSAALAGLGEFSHLSPSVVIARPKHMVRVAAAPFEQYLPIPPSVEAAARQKPRNLNREQRKALLQKQKARKAIDTYPQTGLMIDMDAYIEEPPYPDQLSPHTFIDQAMTDFDEISHAILVETSQP